MPFRLPALNRFGVVDHGHHPVSIPADIEDHVSLNEVGILEPLPNLREVMPTYRLDDPNPRFNLVRSIRILLHDLEQMPPRDNMHRNTLLHIM